MSSGVSFTNFDVDAVQSQLNNLGDIGNDISSILTKLNPNNSDRLIPDDFYKIAKIDPNKTIYNPSFNEITPNYTVDIDTNFGDKALAIINEIQHAKDVISFADEASSYNANGIFIGGVGNPNAVNPQYALGIVGNGNNGGANYQGGGNAKGVSGALFGAQGVMLGNVAIGARQNNAAIDAKSGDSAYLKDAGFSSKSGQLSDSLGESSNHNNGAYAANMGANIAISSGNNRDSFNANVSIDSYNLNNDVVLKDINGNEITINSGNYQILDQKYDEKGNVTLVCIEKDGKRIWLYLDENGNIKRVSLVGVNNQTFTLMDDLTYTLSNGEVIHLAKGNYSIQEYIFDGYGNVVAIALLCEGRKVVIQIRDGKAVNIIDAHSKNYVIDKDIYVYDKNGNIICVKTGTYNIDHYIYDIDGNIIAIVCQIDNELITIRVFDNKNVLGINLIQKDYTLNSPITITLSDGTLLVLEKGTYKIIDALYDKYGSVTALCIEKKDYKIWLYLDKNGIIKEIRYTYKNNGIYVINKKTYIKDKYGNLLAIIDSGNYYIYEVMYDEKGNAIGIRISKDGDDEKWIFFNENSDTGSYSFFNEIINNDNSTISLFGKTSVLFGILGLLVIGIGALYKVKRKNKNNDEEYVDDIKPGNYAIYDYKNTDNGNIKEIRISPSDSIDEYWVEM